MGKGFLERCLLAAMIFGLSASVVVGQDNVTEPGVTVETNGNHNVTEPDIVPETGATEDVPDETTQEGDMPMNVTGNVTVPTQAPTIPTFPPTTEDGCYNNLDAVYFLISDDDTLFQPKRFVICPNSVIEVGFLVPGVGIDQGQAPIVPRSNSEFLCGEDGKSENNCVIKGGDFGVIAVPVFFRQDLSVNNVQIRGFTFEGQVQYASFVATAGDISFYDCIVRDSANFGPFVFNYDSSLDMGRRLEGEEEFDNPWEAALDYVTRYREGRLPTRRLAEEDDKALIPGSERGLQGEIFESTIEDCLFTNLQQVERKLGVEFGVVSVKGRDHRVTIKDCTFANNLFGNQELTPIGYGVLCQEAEIVLDGLCFVDNDFRGNGVVLLEQTANPFAPGAEFLIGNYATEDDADLDCQFAAYFATDEDRRNSNFTCIPVQTDECGGEPIETPLQGGSPAQSPVDDQSGASTGSLSRLILAGLGLVAMAAMP